MTDELKIVGIREEWNLQQKHMADIQNLIFEINHQLSQHNNYCMIQGSVLMTLLSKIFSENGNMLELIDTAVSYDSFVEFIM